MARARPLLVTPLVAVMACLALGLLTPALAQTPDPVPEATGVTMTAEPMLGGRVTPGSWLAVRVSVTNSGPAIDGELRLTALGSSGSTQGVLVQLAPGASQEHVLYVRTTGIGSRFRVTLMRGSETLARTDLTVNTGARGLGAYVIAERPNLISGPLAQAARVGGLGETTVVAIGAADLPENGVAWSPVDLLVWQDIDIGELDAQRLASLHAWLVTGGDLLLIAGSRGPAALAGLPDEVLPFVPSHETQLEPVALQSALGELPAQATAMSALAGELERGRVLAQADGVVLAARAPVGRGSVTLVAIDASTPWLAESAAGAAFWSTIVPTASAGAEFALPADDSFLNSALGTLPTIQLPPTGQLALLVFAYIVTLGPINYLILRRRDRREWAWLTMPITIVVFGVLTFAFGALLRGDSVIVNQLSIVQGAAGTTAGRADVHVGVYSPGRADFQVRVGGSPLVSAPSTMDFDGLAREERPLDVLQGDTVTVRDFGVSFGALRSFRAEAAVATPRIDADLRLDGRTLEGSLTNSSEVTLEEVSVVVGGALLQLGDLGPGETRRISLDIERDSRRRPLSSRLYPAAPDADPAAARTRAARRAIILHLEGGNPWMGFAPMEEEEFMRGSPAGLKVGGPVVLAWLRAPLLAVDVGQAAEQVSETLYLTTVPMAISGSVTLSGGLLQRGPSEVDALEHWEDGVTTTLSGGTLATDYRAVGLEGAFSPRALKIRLSDWESQLPSSDGEDLAPLPAAEQPDPDNPLAVNPRQRERSWTPRVQLFDRAAGQWVEMEPVMEGVTYQIVEPGRYVDQMGGFRIRFVVGRDEYSTFTFETAIEGDVE